MAERSEPIPELPVPGEVIDWEALDVRRHEALGPRTGSAEAAHEQNTFDDHVAREEEALAKEEAFNPNELLEKFRAFQRKWEQSQGRARDAGITIYERTQGATSFKDVPLPEPDMQTVAEALRDHWQGRTPPAEVPIFVRAYQAQRERERRAMQPEVDHGRSL